MDPQSPLLSVRQTVIRPGEIWATVIGTKATFSNLKVSQNFSLESKFYSFLPFQLTNNGKN